jgi:hypothetical protein
VTAVENGSGSEKEMAPGDLSHAGFKYHVARKRLDPTGGGSGELPPHNHSSCHQRPCHCLLCPFLHPPQLHLSARRRMRLYLPGHQRHYRGVVYCCYHKHAEPPTCATIIASYHIGTRTTHLHVP